MTDATNGPVSLAGQYRLSWLWRPHQKQGRSFPDAAVLDSSDWLGKVCCYQDVTDGRNQCRFVFLPHGQLLFCFLDSACRLMRTASERVRSDLACRRSDKVSSRTPTIILSILSWSFSAPYSQLSARRYVQNEGVYGVFLC